MKRYSKLATWKLRKPEIPDNKRKITFDYLANFDYKKFILYPVEKRKKLINDYFKKEAEKVINKFGFENFHWTNSKYRRSVTIQTNLKKFKLFEKNISKGSIIFIKNITYARDTYKPPKFKYYCIRMTISFSFEGFSTGMQRWEDRFILLRAQSYEDAEKKAVRLKKKSLYKFLNSSHILVGEKIESIDDIYETSILSPEDINDPEGTEVFFEYKKRKLTKERYWDVLKA